MIFIFPTDTCFGIACKINDIDSYNKIYKIKNRDYSKPLAVLVKNFDFLKENTFITKEQIDFLKKYHRPYSVLLETKKGFLPKNIRNIELYKKVSFRIANNDIQKDLIKKYGSLFLTSANISGEKEIYKISEIYDNFGNFPEIKIFGEDINDKNPPSDIFEFIGESTQINYIRKN